MKTANNRRQRQASPPLLPGVTPAGHPARVDASARVSRAWVWLLMSFVVVGTVISGLCALTCMPYTPPVDTRLDIEEQLNVWGVIVFLSAVEIVIGVRLTFILLSRPSCRKE